MGPHSHTSQTLTHLRYNEVPREKKGGPRFYVVVIIIDPERIQALFDIVDIKIYRINVP